VYVWDDSKRRTNLRKHGLDFRDACLVYESPEKITVPSDTYGETRMKDIAFVEIGSVVLCLIYTRRGPDVCVISFRAASRSEPRFYAELKGH
jgi:uncharacterized protein